MAAARPAAPPRPDAPLLGAAELERLHRLTLGLRLARQRYAAAPDPGPARALHRGQGMELHDARPYQAGDDIRHMDWRATARSGRPTTKVFLAERQRALFLVVDRGPTMMFGTRCELKAATAARVAAVLAFAALAARESVAGVILGEEPRHAPARTVEGVLPLLTAAAAAPYRPVGAALHAGIAPAYAVQTERLAPRIERGATVCVISDFHAAGTAVDPAALGLPAAAHFETVAIRIRDRAEERLPECGVIRLASPLSGATVTLDTGDAAVRRRYSEAAEQRSRALLQLCTRHGIRVVTVYNDRDVFAQLGVLG